MAVRYPFRPLSVRTTRMLVTFGCLFLVTSGVDRKMPTGGSSLSYNGNMTAGGDRRYINIGDGSSQEFEFPENTKGVIVISSQYRSAADRDSGDSESWRQTVNVRSLDPEVLSILNVSDSGSEGQSTRSYIIGIRSGLAGRARLLIQLLDLDQDSQPVLVEERSDFSIRVSSVANDLAAQLVQSGGLSHFSENPVVFALLPLIFINKCAFGCKVDVEVLRSLARRPAPVLLGVAGQFLVMPLYGYFLSWLVSLPKPLALGLVITCSAPGGGGGYLYSLLLGGDVTLAISMTLVSTVVAVAMMPLSSALYGRLLGVHAALHVPFVKILGTLLFIAIPISLGVGVKLRLPGLTRALLALIRPFSFVLIVGGVFVAYQMGASILAHVRPQIVVVGVTVPVFGLLLGYAMAWGARLAPPHRRTVAIEVGVQNSLLALAVMQLSFRRAEADFASQAPFIVALSSTSEMLLLVLAHLAHLLVDGHLTPPPGPDGHLGTDTHTHAQTAQNCEENFFFVLKPKAFFFFTESDVFITTELCPVLSTHKERNYYKSDIFLPDLVFFFFFSKLK